jgi:diacylglycerol kinase (ATP)
MKQKQFSIKSRFASFRFALKGIVSLLKYEHNSRIHFLAAVIAIAAGIFMKIDRYEWSLLAIVIGLVFLTELLNSSLESLADIIDPEWNELIMKAKDYSAAAVLISAVIALFVGGLIFIPKFAAIF